jgi:hypothetical protein
MGGLLGGKVGFGVLLEFLQGLIQPIFFLLDTGILGGFSRVLSALLQGGPILFDDDDFFHGDSFVEWQVLVARPGDTDQAAQEKNGAGQYHFHFIPPWFPQVIHHHSHAVNGAVGGAIGRWEVSTRFRSWLVGSYYLALTFSS